jgi:hypothetical protein
LGAGPAASVAKVIAAATGTARGDADRAAVRGGDTGQRGIGAGENLRRSRTEAGGVLRGQFARTPNPAKFSCRKSAASRGDSAPSDRQTEPRSLADQVRTRGVNPFGGT